MPTRKRGRPPKSPRICQLIPVTVDGKTLFYVLYTDGCVFTWNPAIPDAYVQPVTFQLHPIVFRRP